MPERFDPLNSDLTQSPLYVEAVPRRYRTSNPGASRPTPSTESTLPPLQELSLEYSEMASSLPGPAQPSSSSSLSRRPNIAEVEPRSTSASQLGSGASRRRPRLDGSYNPISTLRRRNTSERPEYTLEERAPQAARRGNAQRIELPTGPVSTRRGWGNAPYIQSRQGDYAGARVGTDYDDIVRVLGAAGPNRQEGLARAALRMSQDRQARMPRNATPEEQRALSHLVAITQVAEENRTTGSASFARAALRNIADGTSTFGEEFNRTNANFVPARRGGTAEMRRFVEDSEQNSPPYDEARATAANVSESDRSEDERDYRAFVVKTIGPKRR
jgi:hypothetical protein